jgi:hypothetical protein
MSKNSVSVGLTEHMVKVASSPMQMARSWLVGLAACGAAAAPMEKTAVAPPADDHELHVDVATGADGLHIKIVGHAVELAHAPIADLIGMPASGTADVAIDVVVPIDHGARDFRGAKGAIDLRCIAQCALGDDAAPTRVGRRDFGIDLGKLPIDDFELHASIGDGKVEITKWMLHVGGVEVAIAGSIELARTLDESVVNGCARFRPIQADEKMRAITATTGAPIAGDGFYNIRLTGRFGDMHRLAQVCDGSVPIPAEVEPDRTEPPPPLPEQDADLSAIRQVAPNKYEIAHAIVDQILANPMAVAKGARIVPAMKDGKPHGFKLYAIRPASVFAKLGLMNGDTLVTVNGFELTSADKALEIYEKLRDATTIEIEVERKGVRLTIDYIVD